MNNMLLPGLLAILCASCAHADTVIYRVDTRAGVSSTTYAVLTPKVELWAFAPQTPAADLEIGRLWQVPSPKKTVLLAGGYYAFWPDGRKSFLEPYLVAKVELGHLTLAVDGGAYLPLNKGPVITYLNEASLTAPVDSHVQFGLASSVWHQDGQTTTRVGPKLSADLGGGIRLNARYLIGSGNTFRLAVSKAF